MSANDYQVGGTHYQSQAVQPWEAMESWMTKEQWVGFLRGNAIKYLARLGHKDAALQEAKKAQHYLAKLVEVLDD